MALSVVSFNIDGGEGRPEKKEMIGQFLNDQNPSLLYLQENLWRNIKNHVPKIKERYEAVLHGHLHATVLYRTDVLRDEGSEELMNSFRDAFEDRGSLDFKTFKERASFSKLNEIKTGRSFVAISWHGENIGKGLTDKVKKKKFKNLLLVIKEINSETKLPVLLGGDFNISLESVSDSIKKQNLKVYAEYELENRETLIDFFVVTDDVRLSNVRAFGDYMYKTIERSSESEGETNSESEGETNSEREPKQIFDHDPVQAIIHFLDDDQKSKRKGGNTSDKEVDELAQGVRKVFL